MKKILISAITCAAGVLAAQTLWDGMPASVKTASSVKNAQVKVEKGGVITVSGKSAGSERYSYVTFYIKTKPFQLNGKNLALTVSAGDVKPGDTLYIKAQNASRKLVLSAVKWGGASLTPQEYVIWPGNNTAMQWIPAQITAKENDPITTIEVHFGRKGNNNDLKMTVSDIKLVDRPKELVREGNILGIGVASSELRNCAPGVDAKGRPFIIASPLDSGGRTYLLYTEVDTGKTIQYYLPGRIGGAIYGAALTSKGKFTFGISGWGVIFDVNTRKFTMVKGGVKGAHLCCAIAPNGKVYYGSSPSTTLAESDPETGVFRDLGSADPKEHYLQLLAVDKNNYVYCGIGTARANIVAVNPVTGEKTQLLPEKYRKTGSASVLTGIDGYVYASFNGYNIKCLDGKVVEEGATIPGVLKTNVMKYGTRLRDFGNGMKLQDYDMVNRKITVINADGTRKVIPVEYQSGGLDLTSLAKGPDGNIYVSSAHPHHLVRVDVPSNKINDLGYNPIVRGGNFCDMIAAKDKHYACEYAGGRMWEYDPALPVAFRSSVVNMVSFGTPLADLAASGKGTCGRWSHLEGMKLLLGIGEHSSNLLELKVPVQEDGEWYLNILAFKSGAYGSVRVTAGGKSASYNAQEGIPQTQMITLGPLNLKKGTLPIWFTVEKNQNAGSNPFFSIASLELAKQPRKDTAEAVKQVVENPRVIGQWPNLVTRPRTIAVHPSGKEVVMAGFANYGLTGGGFGIYDRTTGKIREISDWLKGESCIALAFLDNGDLVGGTSIEAPGGGHLLAKEATIFRMDWKTGKITKKMKLPGCTNVISVEVFNNKVVAATQTGKLIVLDPQSWKKLAEHNIATGGAVVRNALISYEGRYFLLQSGCISELDAANLFKPEPLAKPVMGITGGGAAAEGKIYYIGNATHVCCWDIPAATKR
ncbi:MAG: PQQ-like beta-propeller repeat protein [Lentisphaeria bacterium]|nr:PQQ-like beta-propeller repeat protein [Lentisphaeria bacterium]